MKRMLILTTALVFLLGLPLAAMAMSHEKMDMDHDKMEMDHGKKEMDMDHGKMDMDHGKKEMDMDHGKMDMGHGMMAGMMMLGEKTEDGVSAMGHAKAYDDKAMASMASMGMTATHHFMIMFKDQNGKPVTEGQVAVKVKSGDQESKPIMLMPMGEGFGADITVPKGEEVELKVGTKLADGKKRQYEFELK